MEEKKITTSEGEMGYEVIEVEDKMEEQKIETEEERKERLYKEVMDSADKKMDAQLVEHARRVERNMRERMEKSRQLGQGEEKLKTPYVDELEWTVKQIYGMRDAVHTLDRASKRIEDSLKTIQATQLEMAKGIQEIWQYIIITESENIVDGRDHKFRNYTDFVKEAAEKGK